MGAIEEATPGYCPPGWPGTLLQAWGEPGSCTSLCALQVRAGFPRSAGTSLAAQDSLQLEAPLTPRAGVQEPQSRSSGQQVCVWSPGPVSSPRPEGAVVSPAPRSLKFKRRALGGHPVIAGSEGLGAARSRHSGQEQCPSSSLRDQGPCGLSAEALRGEPGLPGKTMVAYSVCSGTQGMGGSGVFSRHWKSSSP